MVQPLSNRRGRRVAPSSRGAGGSPAGQLAAADAVGADDDLPVREPLGEQAEQFDQPLGSSAVVGIGRPPGGLGASLGQSLAVLAEAEADGPGEDLGRGRGGPGRSRKRTTQSCPPRKTFKALLDIKGSWCIPAPKRVRPRLRHSVSSRPSRIGPVGAKGATRARARTMPRASRDQAAWLQKRWKRHPCPGPTRPAEKRHLRMKCRRPDSAQPVTSSTKVRKGGGVKTAWKSCSRRRKGG